MFILMFRFETVSRTNVSQPRETMVELRLEGSYSSSDVIGLLHQARVAPIVTKLYLSGVHLDEGLARSIVDLLLSNYVVKSRIWERITFVRCSGPLHIVLAAMSLTKVKELHYFADNDGRCADFQMLSNPELQTVSFGNISLSTENAKQLARNLANNTTLKSFRLSQCHLDRDAVLELSRSLRWNRNLREVHLTECDLSDGQIATLVYALDSSQSLECLQVNGNRCRQQGIAAIAKLLSSKTTRLTALDISDQFGFDDSEPSVDEENTSLPISYLFEAMKSNNSLRSFAARECNLQDHDLRGIVRVLCHHDCIEDVDLQYNQISNEGLKTIFASNLNSMKGLKRILLRQGRGILHEDVRDALIEGLKSNSYLESLDLFQWVDDMEYYFDLNRAGRRLFTDEHFSLSLWPLVFEKIPNVVKGNGGFDWGTRRARKDAIRQANIFYYMLRFGPILFVR